MEYADASWVCPHAPSFVWKSWDDYEVVFNPVSSTTHILNAVAREIVDIVADGPCTGTEIIDKLGKILNQTINLSLQEDILSSLKELDSIGLIMPMGFPASAAS